MKFADDRERKTKAMLVRFTENELAELKRLADVHVGGNVSQFLRLAVDQFVFRTPTRKKSR